MSPFPSGSVNRACCETPVHDRLPANTTPPGLELGPGGLHVGDAEREPGGNGANGCPARGIDDAKVTWPLGAPGGPRPRSRSRGRAPRRRTLRRGEGLASAPPRNRRVRRPSATRSCRPSTARSGGGGSARCRPGARRRLVADAGVEAPGGRERDAGALSVRRLGSRPGRARDGSGRGSARQAGLLGRVERRMSRSRSYSATPRSLELGSAQRERLAVNSRTARRVRAPARPMKSTARRRSCVEPPVEHQRVPVRILEPRLRADACHDRVAVELHALCLQLGAGHVRPGRAAPARRETVKRAVRCWTGRRCPESPDRSGAPGPTRPGLDLEPERVGVEAARALNVLCQERHEVDLPSTRITYEASSGWCSISALPSGSSKNAM